MSSHQSKPNAAKEMIGALKVARDRARIQAHLFSLDAKKRWHALETTLLDLQVKLEQSGEEIAASASSNFREAVQSAKELMHELDGTLELAEPVRKLMKHAPVSCAPTDSLNRAAQIMWDVDCGAVPVLDEGGGIRGMLTDRDICMAAYTRGQPLAAMSVESAMSTPVYSCAPEDSLGHAARLMAEKQVHRLPVVEAGKLVGILALADIARDIRAHGGNRVPACAALAHVLASISEQRPPVERGQAAAE